jgi:hypothetical protein
MILLFFLWQYLCINIIVIYFRSHLKKCFVRVNEVHNYNTRLSSKISYLIPGVRTNYGKFNIQFQGVKVWNDIDENLKYLSP